MPDDPDTMLPEPGSKPEAAYTPRRSARRGDDVRPGHAASHSGGRLRKTGIVLAAAAGVLLLVSVVDLAATSGRVQPGVRVGDVAVGMMTPADARAALETAFAAGAKRPVTAIYGDKSWKLTSEQVGVSLDATGSIDGAMEVGRTGGLFEAGAERVGAMFAGVSVPVLVTGDAAAASASLDTIGGAVAVPALDASVTVSGTSVGLVKSAPGRSMDRGGTLAAIATAFVTDSRTARVVTVEVPVSVADVDAQQALEDARGLVSGPVTVSFESRSMTVGQDEVADWVAFTRTPLLAPAAARSAPTTAGIETSGAIAPYQRMTLVAGFDAARIGSTIASLTAGIGHPARDAAFVASKGKVAIKPSQTGFGADLPALAADLARACVGAGTRKAVLRLAPIQPKLTTEAAQKMGITERLSTYTTYYSSANPARVNNVHLLARAFDYKLIPPGATFSFNGTAGQRTAAKGYQEAPAIVDGKLVPQLGGGVCQVGTTFFNTVFFSGLPIVERHNHSFYISHYPKGRDATVSWGGPNFRFKNDTEAWVLIRTAYSNTSLTIALYGTDPGYTVKYTTGPFTDITPHKVIEVKDPKLRKGIRRVEDAGVDGCHVVVVRTVYKAGVVVRTDTFVSNYSSKDETVRVGTKVVSVPTTPTVTP